jgi:NAD binding domain of 6-phosphogluconate dehydrogenase
LRQVELVDAPVSGWPPTMTVMIGASDAAFAKYRPLFDVIAANVFHVGPSGAGATAKLVTQYLGYTNFIASIEGMLVAAPHSEHRYCRRSGGVGRGGPIASRHTALRRWTTLTTRRFAASVRTSLPYLAPAPQGRCGVICGAPEVGGHFPKPDLMAAAEQAEMIVILYEGHGAGRSARDEWSGTCNIGRTCFDEPAPVAGHG